MYGPDSARRYRQEESLRSCDDGSPDMLPLDEDLTDYIRRWIWNDPFTALDWFIDCGMLGSVALHLITKECELHAPPTSWWRRQSEPASPELLSRWSQHMSRVQTNAFLRWSRRGPDDCYAPDRYSVERCEYQGGETDPLAVAHLVQEVCETREEAFGDYTKSIYYIEDPRLCQWGLARKGETDD